MDGPYNRIVCCVDRDPMAQRVIDEARALAGGRPFSVVHVVAPPHSLVSGPFAYVAPIVELRSEAEAWLADLLAGTPDAEPVLLEGSPARELCRWARDTRADLIVAAAYRSRMERAMLGGFAAHIAYHAPCSVLLVHQAAVAAESGAAAGEAATTAG